MRMTILPGLLDKPKKVLLKIFVLQSFLLTSFLKIDASSARENDLRLVNWKKGFSVHTADWYWYRYQGTVEIFKDSEWQAICDSDWNIKEANVVCRQLGYGNANYAYTDGDESYWISSSSGGFPGDDIPVAFNDVTCDGDEISLAACTMTNRKDVTCDSSMNVGVSCDGPEG